MKRVEPQLPAVEGQLPEGGAALGDDGDDGDDLMLALARKIHSGGRQGAWLGTKSPTTT